MINFKSDYVYMLGDFAPDIYGKKEWICLLVALIWEWYRQ